MTTSLECVHSSSDGVQVLVYNVAAFRYGGFLDLTPTDFEDLWKVRA